jgi:hypothetical protein
LTEDNPQLGAGPAFEQSPGHPIAHEATEARATLRMTTQERPYLGGPASFELGPQDHTAAENMTIDDRKEIGTYNRAPIPDRKPFAFANNQHINIQLKPDTCTDYTRTANLEVAQYSHDRVVPRIMVPNDKYSDELQCHNINPILIVTRQENTFANDVRRAFTMPG